MDILRIDTSNYGPVYVRSDALFAIGRIDEVTTNVGVSHNDVKMDLTVAGDVDEVAAMFETNGGFRIRRVN